jgi:hypothetical protein
MLMENIRMNAQYSFSWLKNRYIIVSLLLLSTLVVSGCGGGSSTSNTPPVNSNDTGTVLIAVTDAEGDFIRYSVDVLSINLTHADGRVVETLPTSSRVDFAEYTSLTEFITAASVPNGRYIKGSMLLDFSNADIWVESATGEAIAVNSITDVNGDSVTTIEVSVILDGLNSLPIASGLPKHLTLDFDLKASNTVTVATTSASIIVEPKLIASIDLDKSKQHRLRGPLKSVDVAANSFELFIRPFRHRLVPYKKHFGTLKVVTIDTTLYEIDKRSYEGNAGLDVMATLARLTGVVVRGNVKFDPLRFEAEQVYAGSSVPGDTLDVVKGSVISRTANSIKVHGAIVTRADGRILFNDAITVQLADSTIVKVQQSMADHSIVDVSIGSRITLFGSVTDETSSNFQFDASNGYARIGFSDLKAEVVGIVAIPEQALPLVVNLQSINGRRATLYNFDGTGVDSARDAVAGKYEIDTGTLNLPTFLDKSFVAIHGSVTHFGAAPKDFKAKTVVKFSTTAP